jgi:Cu+-exporting ATPase
VGALVAAVEAPATRASLAGEGRTQPRDTVAHASVGRVALTVPLALVAMVPPLHFDGWEWLALALSTPVVFWAGLPFHRTALRNLRHGP